MPRQYSPIRPVRFMGLRDPVRDRYGAYRHHGLHAGIDIYPPEGEERTLVKASLGGTVVRASRHGTYGNLVIIDHTPEIKAGKNSDFLCYVYTLYAHLHGIGTGLGKKVRQGGRIGTVGNTGNAKGMDPHLHFETVRAKVRLTWNPHDNTGYKGDLYRLNPLDFLRGFSLPDECFEPMASQKNDSYSMGWGLLGSN